MINNLKQTNKWTQLLYVIIGLILVNTISSRLNLRYDATAEKRFSITQPTKQLLRKLDETVVVEVYLKGKFPGWVSTITRRYSRGIATV
jgi:ABC-type uncharacterized transport system.